MRHGHKVFYALLALCALALPCIAQIQRDRRTKQPPVTSQTGARVKRVTLGAAGVVTLPKRSPLQTVVTLAPLSKSALAAMFAGAGTQQVQSTSLVEYLRLSARQPYVEGKGSLVFSDGPFNAMFDWVNSSQLWVMFKPEPGKQYIIEFGILGGNTGKNNPHPIKVAIGPGWPPLFDVKTSAEQMLEFGDHQLLFEYTPQNADQVVVTMFSDAAIIFHYCRIVSVQ